MFNNDEFHARVQAWHILLKDRPGQKFALYFNDSLEFASALFGGWQAGKIWYLPGDNLPATCESLCNVVDDFIGEFPSYLKKSFSPLPVLRERVPKAGEGLDYADLVIYTSGSTGNPQAIPKRLPQLMAEIATLENLFGDLIGDAEIVATVSHQHIYGLLFKILWPLTTGRNIHVHNAVFLEELIPILTTRPSVLITSPAHLKRFIDSPVATTFSYLHAIFSSSAVLPLHVAQTIQQQWGKTPIEIYGSSETGGIAWRQRPQENWQPMPGVEWRIEPKENTLEICSPHLPDNNWFPTADRVTAAENNCFSLQQRIDRIVKLEGKRISLDAIEHRLAASPLVTETRVLMLECQRIAAFIVLNADGRTMLAKIGKPAFNKLLRHHLINYIEPIALPRSWRYLDALPINAQGKTTQADLIALLDQECPTLPQQRLLEKNAERTVFELTIPSNLFYFKGHFPNTPILPGVVQVDWAIIYARQSFNLPLFFRGIQLLKFQNVIQPGMVVILELLYDNAKSTLIFRLHSQMGQHASGRILFGPSDD